MAKGIQLAGGFGAGGVKDALVELLAQRMAQDEFDAKQRATFNAEQLARETLGQRKTEATAEDVRAKAGLAENKRQFGENLGLNVKKLGEDTRQFDVTTGENVRQFDTGLEFKKGESTRDQGNKDRGFDLDERQLGEASRHNRASEGIAGQRAASGGAMRKITYTDENGETVEEYVTPDEARARGPMKKPKTQKPVTGAERQTLAFYNRAKEASDTLSQGGLEGRIAEQNAAGALWGQYAPNIAQSKDQQMYRQAQRAFTEARLRKESGAAIPPAEYESDSRIYFAQPGDSKETIAQKQKARQAVLEGLKFSSGRAHDEFYGESSAPGGDDKVELIFDPKTGRAMPKEP